MLNKIVLSRILTSRSLPFGGQGRERLYSPAAFWTLSLGGLFKSGRTGLGKICLSENEDLSFARHSLAGIWLGGYAGYNDSTYKIRTVTTSGYALEILHA
ncbi:hypothetical protein [Dyadobacter helix]|nr:hypothetical protein [Dyadobacter sp. CECT 9275]